MPWFQWIELPLALLGLATLALCFYVYFGPRGGGIDPNF